jgi:hypothetical protein
MLSLRFRFPASIVLAFLLAWPAAGQTEKEHLAFQPLKRPTPPVDFVSANKAWGRNPIDAFILARLEKESGKI